MVPKNSLGIALSFHIAYDVGALFDYALLAITFILWPFNSRS